MQATQINFLRFLQGEKQFLIPIYQRTYSWERQECEKLWDDILHVAQNDMLPSHFLGSVVYVSKGIYQVASLPQMLVIDGQQRLTTLILLLAALGDAFKKQGNKIEWNKICDFYLFNQYKDRDDHYKLLLTQSDKPTLISLLEGYEEPERVSTRLKENYQLFKTWINENTVSLETLYRGINKLIIVDIALEQHDNPQLIFESLNSTGRDLSQADLIRNYILMGLDNAEQIRLYEQFWYPMEQSFGQTRNADLFNRFMRDFLTLHNSDIPNMNAVYTTFKIYHQSRFHIPTEQIVEDIYQYSKYFTRMALSHEKDAELRRCFENIQGLDVNVVYPFLLEVYADYERQRLSHADFVAILTFIENYVFRRIICGMYTAILSRVFATLAKEIDKEHYLESVQAVLLQRSTNARFPRDEEFQAAFVIKDVYNFRYRRYLLNRLENDNRKERVNVDEYTIEHILPQNPDLSLEWQEELGPHWQEVQGKYLHTIGNLTLTGYNSEMSDRPFREKRDMDYGFAHSPLRLNAGLGQLEHWNAEEIEKHTQQLAERALQIWTMPPLADEQINKYGPRVQQRFTMGEVIGPVDHPEAGFIPAGYKVVPLNEKKLNYYKLVDGKWVIYGNGKDAWYARTWKSLGNEIRRLARKNEYPLGSGGALHPRFGGVAVSDELEQDHIDYDDDNGN